MSYDPKQYMWKAKTVSELTREELEQAICQMIAASKEAAERARRMRGFMP